MAAAPSVKRRVGVLISGGGSNMAALIAAAADPAYPAEIVCVLSNRADAGGLAKARAARVPVVGVVDHKDFLDRESFERALQRELTEAGVELVVLAGFMRLLTPWFIERWRDRLINIHPALLPAYKGLHTHARALADGVKITGCTVHFVRPEMDVGPIIVQAAVPVLDGDTPETLADRVLECEHRIYPLALARVATGAARVTRDAEGREIVVTAGTGAIAERLISPA
jgi:phosphoribosylglycinamide formyltransferase-1